MFAAVIPHLPELAPEDRALLTRYFECGSSLFALAASLRETPLNEAPGWTIVDLYAWAASPGVSAWIEFDAEQRTQAEVRHMLEVLSRIAQQTDNPIEGRRAATTVLRAIGALGPASRSLRSALAAPIDPADPGIDPPPRKDPADENAVDTALPPLEMESTPELDALREEFFAPGPDRVDTLPESPVPHPDVNPVHVACHMIAAMQRADPASNLALFNHSGIPDRSMPTFENFIARIERDFQHVRTSDLCDVRWHQRTGQHAYECELVVQRKSGSRPIIRLSLFRPVNGPLARCWLVDFFADSG